MTISWNLFEATEETNLGRSAEEEAVALITQGILERFDELVYSSDDEPMERSDDGDENADDVEPHVSGQFNCTRGYSKDEYAFLDS